MAEVGSTGFTIMMRADMIVIIVVGEPATVEAGRADWRLPQPGQVSKCPFSEINELALTKP